LRARRRCGGGWGKAFTRKHWPGIVAVAVAVAVDITELRRQVAAEGWEIDPEDIVVLSPNRREVIRQFGDYVTEGLHVPPAPFDPRLDLVTMPLAA
jgi:hypothetical protein